jgi:phospholipase D1/2
MFASIECERMGQEFLELNLLSYNIHSCFGIDGRYDPSRVASIIEESGADLVALQEVDSSLEVRDGLNQLQYLAYRTGLHSLMGPTLKRGYGSYGNALLSRWPFEAAREINLTYRKFEPRGLLQAKLTIQDQKISLFNTHFGLKHWERKFQAARLCDELENDIHDCALIFGDFNEWFGWSRNLRWLEQSFSKIPRVPTYPSRWPRFALDRIFASPEAHFTDWKILSDQKSKVASDHLPVMGKVRVPIG